MGRTGNEVARIIPTGEATGLLAVSGARARPVTIIGTHAIRKTFDEACLQQVRNVAGAPGVSEVVLNPDAHVGYGAPIGCVLVSPSHIYPGPVGVDIKCSMSLLQLDVPADQIEDPRTRRALIQAICQRTPTGPGRGQRNVPKSRPVSEALGRQAVVEGASPQVCAALGIPAEWARRCEDASHTGHDKTRGALATRLEWLVHHGRFGRFAEKIRQLGSYGGGNHFGECEVVRVADTPRARRCARVFGLRDGFVAFLSHCGSRGFGHNLAVAQFRAMREHFERAGIPLPAGDRYLVHAPLGTPEADAYLDDMALGANYATVNHLLINALVLEAFQEVLPGTTGTLVYLISHNIAREEIVRNRKAWVHRKGATRAFPARHPGLSGTPFYDTGHPILLPGSPIAGSRVMVAEPGAERSCFSINHGAGRQMGRRQAIRALNQRAIDDQFGAADIMTNCRNYPRDEAPCAYKDFNEVVASVEKAGLATTVATLCARFVIKDADKPDD